MNCVSCASAAIPAHTGLCDRLYGSAGEWSLHRCENHACDLHWLDPQPTPAQLRAAYAVYYTHESADKTPRGGLLSRLARGAVSGYLERRYGYSVPRELEPWKCLWPALYLLPARRVGAEREVMFLSAQPGARLLDVGCGSGDRLSKMNQLGWCSEGVEPDPAAAATARKLGHRVWNGFLEEARFPAGSFDAISLCHVVEHLRSPGETLRECSRLLRPGGRLVLATPNVSSWGHRWFGQDWRGLEPPRHLFVFGPKSLRQLLLDAGFSEPSVWSTVSRYVLEESVNLRRVRIPSRFWGRSRVSRPGRTVLVAVEIVLGLFDPFAGGQLVGIAAKPDGSSAASPAASQHRTP